MSHRAPAQLPQRALGREFQGRRPIKKARKHHRFRVSSWGSLGHQGDPRRPPALASVCPARALSTDGPPRRGKRPMPYAAPHLLSTETAKPQWNTHRGLFHSIPASLPAADAPQGGGTAASPPAERPGYTDTPGTPYTPIPAAHPEWRRSPHTRR